MIKYRENADGEIHPLSEDFAYILNYFPCGNDPEKDIVELSKKQKEFSRKYAEYMLEFERDHAIQILVEHLMPDLMGTTHGDHSFIYRPPWLIGSLAQMGSIALKFKRAEKDNLEFSECDH